MKDNKLITSKITNKEIVIKIPKKALIDDYNNDVDYFKIKGNKKTEFIKEFTRLLVNEIESELIIDIYDQLCDTDLVKEITY